MPTVSWRMKSMPLAEWTNLQEQFGNLQIASGGPEALAMFVKGAPDSANSDIYITGPGITVIEALSPGGWQDTKTPEAGNLSLLVGAGDPWTYFGIS